MPPSALRAGPRIRYGADRLVADGAGSAERRAVGLPRFFPTQQDDSMSFFPRFNLVKDRMAKAARRGRLARRNSAPLRVEVLEDRVAPSVTSLFTTATGTLTVTSDGGDAIAIARGADGNVKVNSADPTTGGPAAASAVQHIDITGGPGDNR